MSEFSPFDNTKTVKDESGNPVRFLADSLAETYIEPPDAWISDGMLPPQEMEVRKALVTFKFASDSVESFGLLSRMIGSTRYRDAKNQLQLASKSLMTLVNSSREHKAAIRRIVSAMPVNNGGREILAAYVE